MHWCFSPPWDKNLAPLGVGPICPPLWPQRETPVWEQGHSPQMSGKERRETCSLPCPRTPLLLEKPSPVAPTRWCSWDNVVALPSLSTSEFHNLLRRVKVPWQGCVGTQHLSRGQAVKRPGAHWRLPYFKKIANWKVKGNGPHKTITTNSNCKFRGFPKQPSVSIICWKDSRDSQKAVILTVLVYHRKRIQIKIKIS